MNFNFGEVLTRAWQIIWKHKVLWIFGIFAGCGQGGGGNGGGNTGFETQGQELPPEVLRWFQIIEDNLATIIGVGLVLICLIWIIMIFLSTVGRIGLIRGTFQADGGAERLIFGQLFSECTPYFWRIFGLSLLVSLPIVILIAALVAAGLALAIAVSSGNDSSGIGFLAILPLIIGCFCLFIPVMFVIGMIVRQAERAIVLENLPVLPALSRGWEVFRNHLGPIILMAILLAVISLVIGFVIAIPIFILVVPAVIAFAVRDAQNWTPLIFMGIGLCLYIPVSLLLEGIMTAYIESAWTLTYMRLTAKPLDNPPAVLEANA